MKRIGVLTGGGVAPGLNAAIRAVVTAGEKAGYQLVGFRNGWEGVIDPDKIEPWEHWHRELFPLAIDPFEMKHISGILKKAGTILHTTRTNPRKIEDGFNKILKTLEEKKIDVLIPFGGEDTLSVALDLSKMGIKVVGVPKTIDNDVGGTEYCLGFATAQEVVSRHIDTLKNAADAHHRIFVVETPGRKFGWLAVYGGKNAGADFCLIPEILRGQSCEENIELFERKKREMFDVIQERRNQGKLYSLITVSEGLEEVPGIKERLGLASSKKTDQFGHKQLGGGGVANALANIIANEMNVETKAEAPGRICNGAPPCDKDIEMATEFGIKAIELVKKEKFGRLIAWKNGKVTDLPLKRVFPLRPCDFEAYEKAKLFFN